MQMDVAVCHEPRAIRIEREAVETPAPSEVLVKVAFCGVCPWDLRAYSGLSTSTRFPLRLGHEVSGIVEAVGAGVHGFQPGDRVAVDVIRRCGTCRHCQAGRENHCERADYSRGGFAGYLVAPAGNVYPLAGSTPLIEAALIEPLACALRGQNRVGVNATDTVLVVGAGPLGLLHGQVAAARGARWLVSDPRAARRQAALELGAALALDPQAEGFQESLRTATGGDGCSVAILAMGLVEALPQALAALGLTGRLLLFAGFYPQSSLSLDLNSIHYRELLIAGTSDYTRTEFRQALELIEAGAVRIAPLISHVYPLADIEQALATTRTQAGLKVMVQCNELEHFAPQVLA